MKLIRSSLVILSLLILASCESEELDYTDFAEHLPESYVEAETKENKRYILYYFGQNCSHCKDVKQEMLSFFSTYEMTEFYILDVSADSVRDVSRYDEFHGTPSLFFIADGEVLESYVGSGEIREFLKQYENQEISWSLFNEQIVNDTNDFSEINDNHYLVYYHETDDKNSTIIEEPFLEFAFGRSPNDVYFVNYETAELSETFANLGDEPLLLEMSYGNIMAEHSGQDILQYINTLDNQSLNDYPVNPENDEVNNGMTYDYSDFNENLINDYSQSFIIDDSIHYEYYFSPNCSHCNAVKQTILPFFLTTELPFYLFDVSASIGSIPEGLTGVPALFVIEDNVIIEMYVGSLEIPAYINNQEN